MTTSPAKPETNIKETIESVLVAFILAFIFRAFVVEAFIIPTGSMAPTLMGAYLDFRCPDCGYQYAVNYDSATGDSDNIPEPVASSVENGRLKERVMSVYCPNCGYKLPRVDKTDAVNDATAAPVRMGDRILVLKYAYLLHPPERWDVVVFKNPNLDRTPAGSEYEENYIKRLTGRPGETIMVLDGDIYTSTNPTDVARLTPGDFTVATKPWSVQEALWRVVYDNRYHPRGLKPTEAGGRPVAWSMPWVAQGGTGWKLDSRVIDFDNTVGSSTIRFADTGNAQVAPLTDWLAYNQTANQVGVQLRGDGSRYYIPWDTYNAPPVQQNEDQLNAVSDVKLSLVYERLEGDGPLMLRLTKLGQQFVAEINKTSVRLLSGPIDAATSQLTELARRDDIEIGSSETPIDFVNADYRVSLRVNGHELLATTPQQYSPDVPQLLKDFDTAVRHSRPIVEVTAANQKARFAGLGLYRDVFYQNQTYRATWGIPANFPEGSLSQRLIRLKNDEYFVCGDNSARSLDARMWTSDVELPHENLMVESGRVPKRFMMGKAFFVYWPSGYRVNEMVPFSPVPNVGKMRFIH